MQTFGRSLEAPLAPFVLGQVNVEAIAASVRVVSDDILEVQRYGDGILRLTILFVFVILATITIFLPWWNGWLDLSIPRILLDQSAFFGSQFDQTKAVDSFLVTEDRATYISTRLFGAQFWREAVDFFFLRVVPLLLFTLMVFWPKAAPLRVDRKHQIVYTKHWGRLVVLPIMGRSVDLNAGLLPAASFQSTTAWGPLMIQLVSLSRGRPIRISLGVAPANHPQQNINIYNAINSFVAHHGEPNWHQALRHHQAEKQIKIIRAILSGGRIRLGFSSKDIARITTWRGSTKADQ